MSVLLSTKCHFFHSFKFVYSYNIFLINHALKVKYQPGHLRLMINKHQHLCWSITFISQLMHSIIQNLEVKIYIV